jgi:hypothetical protein
VAHADIGRWVGTGKDGGAGEIKERICAEIRSRSTRLSHEDVLKLLMKIKIVHIFWIFNGRLTYKDFP